MVAEKFPAFIVGADGTVLGVTAELGPIVGLGPIRFEAPQVNVYGEPPTKPVIDTLVVEEDPVCAPDDVAL
jgi:hypothetical protein